MTITIVTPSFRQVSYLRRCAASVADQTGAFTHEHLIQDGGSGIDFDQWAAEQTFADIRKENDEGMYDAINRGFRRATGDIVCWLNCDEQYLPGALDAVARWFARHPDHDILFGDVVIASTAGNPLSYRQALVPLRGHVRWCFLPTYSAATFIRRRIIDEGHLLDPSRIAIADAIWIHDLLGLGFHAGVLNEALAVFTQTGSNLGQSDNGLDESRQWRGSHPVRHMAWGLVHRLRKGLAGCYRKRPVSLDIYVGDNKERSVLSGSVSEVWRAGKVSASR